MFAEVVEAARLELAASSICSAFAMPLSVSVTVLCFSSTM